MTNDPLIPELVAQLTVPVPHYRPKAVLASAPSQLLPSRDEVLKRARQMRTTILMNPSGQSSQQLFEIDQAIREVSSLPSLPPSRPGVPERPEVATLRETLARAQELLQELANHPTLQ